MILTYSGTGRKKTNKLIGLIYKYIKFYLDQNNLIG